MTCRILTFPSKAKPRVVLHVPTSSRVVELWAELNERLAAAWKNPTPHNQRMVESSRARYIKACQDENYPA